MKLPLHLFAFLTAAASCNAAAILSPSDFIVAVNQNTSTQYGVAHGTDKITQAIDGTSSKYLNTGGAGSGFIVTPGASVMQSFVIQSGNDANHRDPLSYEVWGTNQAIASTNNSTGTGETWTLISKGALPETTYASPFNKNLAPVSFSNTTSYSSYKVVFPLTKYNTGSYEMQINEFTAFTGTGGTGTSIIAPASPIIAIDTPVSVSYHNALNNIYGNDQGAGKLIDGVINSGNKYLNYAKENSGFIVTPAAGSTVLRSFTITTGGDAIERDPSSYTIYGTNAPITTVDNGFGTEDLWTAITTNTLTLSTDRLATSNYIEVPNNTAYTSYRMVFNTIRNAAGANSVQVSEVQFYDVVPEPSIAALSGLALIALGARRRR